LALVSLRIWAQSPVIARGRLLECDTGESGELSIRLENDRVYWYAYNSKTSVEQDHQPTSVPKLHKGDEIEIISDSAADVTLGYARIIHVLESQKESGPPPPPVSRGRYAMPRHPVAREDPLKLEMFMLRGTLDFAGLVCQLNDERMVLRTRADGEKTIYMRPDTRFMKDGVTAAASALRLNTRVYVRGSKNLEGEIEAFQVIWGSMLAPASF